MEVVNEAFNVVRQLLKSTVPPCTATIDNADHYEVRAINPEQSKNVLFGYVIKHADSVTVGFNDKLGKSKMKQLFSAYLLQKMNEQGRIRIHDINHQLHSDLQEAVSSLMRYYNEENWYLS